MNATPNGTAFLALWNNISDAGRRHEYEQWHLFEHVPERVALPGFVGADRYRSFGADPGYFTVYHLDDLSALESTSYRDVFTNPTPWSARMRPVLSDFYRLPCLLSGSVGTSRAPFLITVRWSADQPTPPAQMNTWLADHIETGRLVHAQWGWAPPTERYWLANAPSETADQGIEHVALLQHCDLAGLEAVQEAFLRHLRTQASRVGEIGTFMLQSTHRSSDSEGSPPGRRPPHSVLFNHHSRG